VRTISPCGIEQGRVLASSRVACPAGRPLRLSSTPVLLLRLRPMVRSRDMFPLSRFAVQARSGDVQRERAGLDEINKYAATQSLKNAGGNSQHGGERCGIADCGPHPMTTERPQVLRARELIQGLTPLCTKLQVVAFLVVPAIAVVAGVRNPSPPAPGVQDETFAPRVSLNPECQPQGRVILDCDRVAILTCRARRTSTASCRRAPRCNC